MAHQYVDKGLGMPTSDTAFSIPIVYTARQACMLDRVLGLNLDLLVKAGVKARRDFIVTY
ncbi:hypothetical protein GCM10027297_10570 [Parahaliea aestuarii]